eukprot:1748253-Pleurochrysis_carterae.AAC.3
MCTSPEHSVSPCSHYVEHLPLRAQPGLAAGCRDDFATSVAFRRRAKCRVAAALPRARQMLCTERMHPYM